MFSSNSLEYVRVAFSLGHVQPAPHRLRDSNRRLQSPDHRVVSLLTHHVIVGDCHNLGRPTSLPRGPCLQAEWAHVLMPSSPTSLCPANPTPPVLRRNDPQSHGTTSLCLSEMAPCSYIQWPHVFILRSPMSLYPAAPRPYPRSSK